VGSSLTDEAKIVSVAGASDVFGKMEGDSRPFRTSDKSELGSERYEATWGEFRESVRGHPYGPYWCGIIEQAVISATTVGAEVDNNLVLISNRENRYRVIPTTVTTYFNNESEVSLYLVEALQRRERGDVETTNLLNCLIVVSRFRFAFLEGSSPFYWLNFGRSAAGPRELLMELDYLKSESINANIDQPGVWERFLDRDSLTKMMANWNEVDSELRKACTAALVERKDAQPPNELIQQIVTQLQKLYDSVIGFNTLLGKEISAQLCNAFKEGDQPDSPSRLK
jgi:hypothetical protein